jgi:hypothetical protein
MSLVNDLLKFSPESNLARELTSIMAGDDLDVDGFEDYTVKTNETPVSYIAAVGLFVALSIALVAPFACWIQGHAMRRKMGGCVAPVGGTTTAEQENGACPSKAPHHQQQEMRHDMSDVRHQHATEDSHPPNVADVSIFHREHLAAMKKIANEKRLGKALHSVSQTHRARMQDPNNADRLSAVPSVATTSRLYGPGSSQRRPFRSRKPWGHGGPLPRSETVRRFVELERQSQLSEEGSHSLSSRNSRAAGQPHLSRSRIVSEAAGTFLDEQSVQGESEYFRQKYVELSRSYGRRTIRHMRRPSTEGGSDVGSLMPPLDQDAIFPHDAVDHQFPGQLPDPVQYGTYETTTDQTSQNLAPSDTISAQFLNILDAAEPDYETKRTLRLAIPSSIGAVADPLFRIVLVAIISHFINTDSMVAYVLVTLFIRLTSVEISEAIVDAESNIVECALMLGGDLGLFHAGQTIQLAIFFQIVIGVPVLLMWFFIIDNVVIWLVSSSDIATFAKKYTGVIIIDYILKGASRSFMQPTYLTERTDVAQFEANVDLMATILTAVAIAIVATTNELTLEAIGWIQVIIGIAKAITKVAYVTFRGWLLPYNSGLLKGWAFKVSLAATRSKIIPLYARLHRYFIFDRCRTQRP